MFAHHRVKDLDDIRHRFKVDVNAQQYNLTGIALICHQPKTALVVVEGGPKGIKKFTKLMLRRIKWNVKTEQEDEEDEVSSEDEEEGGEDEEVDMKTSLETGDNRCDLLWRGIVVRRTFHAFRFQECRTSVSARKVHYMAPQLVVFTLAGSHKLFV
jgi:U4/U6 small nuclear ribonucleoprotein PRP3